MNGKFVRCFLLFLTGGIVYFYFEILVRGYSHISMFLLGGICFLLVGTLGTYILNKRMHFLYRLAIIMLSSTAIITTLELFTGLIVNVYMELAVWDYSKMSFNYMGQICLLYSILWGILGLVCVYIYGIIDKFVFEGTTEE